MVMAQMFIEDRPNAEVWKSDENVESELGFTNETIRRGFIRKVYSILLVQLAVIISFIAPFVYVKTVRLWAVENTALVICALVIKIILLIVLVCCDSVRRKYPTNFICLGLFTILDGFLIGFITSIYDAKAVLLAVGITAAITFALTLFSFQTKWDVTGCGAYLFVFLIVFIIFGIIAGSLFYSQNTFPFKMIYACGGALLFSFFLVYDTQLMIGEGHKYSISPEEYILAALSLYLDIINIFLYILRIVALDE